MDDDYDVLAKRLLMARLWLLGVVDGIEDVGKSMKMVSHMVVVVAVVLDIEAFAFVS